MSNSRVPLSIPEFKLYLDNTETYLLAGTPVNYVRLGITADEMALITGFKTRSTPLYVLYSDKQKTRTPLVVAELQDVMDEYNSLNQSNHILDRIASSPNVTVEDLKTFNIKAGPSPRTVPVQPIQESVLITFLLLGGGSVTIKCHSDGSLRAAITDDADSVQYLFVIGTTPPESAKAAGLAMGLSTKATFTLALGSDTSTKTLYIYFRWYNTKHPELAGPWSAMQSTLIL